MKNKATYRWLACLSAGLLLLSCTNRPHHVLSENKMADVLTDLYIAEAAMQDNPADSLPAILEKHNISGAKFDTSLGWYHANLAQYQQVNEQIIAECTRRLADLRTQQQKIQLAEKLNKSFYYHYPSENFNPIQIPQNTLLP